MLVLEHELGSLWYKSVSSIHLLGRLIVDRLLLRLLWKLLARICTCGSRVVIPAIREES